MKPTMISRLNIIIAAFGVLISGSCLAQEDVSAAVGIPELGPPIALQPSPFAVASLDEPFALIELQSAREQIRDAQDRELLGDGTTVAVIDTGLFIDHNDFNTGNRIVAQLNLTQDNGAKPDDSTDGNGHGTHVAGIIAADGDRQGIAPMAKIIPIKALHDRERTAAPSPTVTERIAKSLQWVIDHREEYGITAVNLSISDPVLRKEDLFASSSPEFHVRKLIRRLRVENVPVIAAAGNHYSNRNNAERLKKLDQGMGFPAIIRETISVSAVYESESRDGHKHTAYNNAKSNSIVLLQIAPFAPRLHDSVSPHCRTDLFAPGGLRFESSGIGSPEATSRYEDGGTSQAAPVVTGVVLLLQQFYKSHTGELPLVDDLEHWLREGGQRILDGDDEHDNVRHTCQEYRVVDVFHSLVLAQKQVNRVRDGS